MKRAIHEIDVNGIDVDEETRCMHWHSDLDVIAIKFKCCGDWFACFDCHEAVVDHPHQVWPMTEFSTQAILCGACGDQMSVAQYIEGNSKCAKCGKHFNPGCSKHFHLYFEKAA